LRIVAKLDSTQGHVDRDTVGKILDVLDRFLPGNRGPWGASQLGDFSSSAPVAISVPIGVAGKVSLRDNIGVDGQDLGHTGDMSTGAEPCTSQVLVISLLTGIVPGTATCPDHIARDGTASLDWLVYGGEVFAGVPSYHGDAGRILEAPGIQGLDPNHLGLRVLAHLYVDGFILVVV